VPGRHVARRRADAGQGQRAHADDLWLVECDPLANIKLIESPAQNFVVIMKDGTIYKNTAA
jgi:hypothetical protein